MDSVISDPDQPTITSKLNAIVSLRRSLGIHALNQKDARHVRKQNETGKAIESSILSAFGEDDFLARPQ
jgi:hypothetical protein